VLALHRSLGNRGVGALLRRVAYTPGGKHDHTPSGKWADVQKNPDLRFAFGAIDRLDVEVDFDANTITAWFQDRYEWHPVYPGLYKKWSDDDARETNCVHAALVELQSSGAADYWMKGEATVPLSALSAGSAPKKKSSGWW
jgi:hypothetical protein